MFRKAERSDEANILVHALNNLDEDVKEVIILIGSGPRADDSWCQNIVFDSHNKHLIINIDPHFAADLKEGLVVNTAEKKYIAMRFDEEVASTIASSISNLLSKNIKVVFCDYRSPAVSRDVYQLITANAEHYNNPNSSTGNLIYLQGYMPCYPFFWPTEEHLSSMAERFHSSTSIMAEYSTFLNKLRTLTSGKWHDLIKYFMDKEEVSFPLSHFMPEHDNGVIFSYEKAMEISQTLAENRAEAERTDSPSSRT
ncbi:hypothetical protein [Legionella fallonii]|uniref:Uncharacterized protein n=1 Tax=Legionella fallonii LLAP-10 TaxID=1212491 RepID=A0A098G214_9GAMM|nr:hypothetical protein [Legionella fallonii]CEG55535.1 protein of unknown function [Legionella fallonii LLAP-10]